MSEFQILDERKYPLKISLKELDILPYYRWEHRATLSRNFREFLVMVDNLKTTIYVEEVVGGVLKQIEEETLWTDIVMFVKERGFLELQAPILKPADSRTVTIKDLTSMIDDSSF